MSFKFYKTTPLIIIVIVMSGLIDNLVINLINPLLTDPLLNNLRVPSTVSLLVACFVFYDKVLWKFPVFKVLMTVPNIAGRYRGKIKYIWDGEQKEKECFIEINQTASKIKIYTYFSDEKDEHTYSKSMCEDIKLEENGFYEIYFFYQNDGSKQGRELDCHEGANKLRFIPGYKGLPNELRGHYFTNRLTQTKGEIESILVSKRLLGKF